MLSHFLRWCMYIDIVAYSWGAGSLVVPPNERVFCLLAYYVQGKLFRLAPFARSTRARVQKAENKAQ